MERRKTGKKTRPAVEPQPEVFEPSLDPDYLRSEVLEMLEIAPERGAQEPKITPLLRKAKLLDDVWDILEGSSEPDARALLTQRAKLKAAHQEAATIEDYCVAAGISSKKTLALIASEVFEQNGRAGALIAAISHPDVVQATVTSALDPQFGAKDRQMLHQHAGFLPVPKTSITNVRGDLVGEKRETHVAVLPSLEDTARRIGDRFAEQAALPGQVLDIPSDLPEDAK